MARDYTAYWSGSAGSDSTTSYDSTKTYDDTAGGEVFFTDWLLAPFTWYTPKTDWTAQDKINAEDFNAIEANTETARLFLASIQYAMPSITTVTNRTQTYVDFLASINRIESNLDSIRANFLTPAGYLPMETWTSGKGFDYADANRLELDLKLIFEYGSLVVDSYRYCGAYTCGDGGALY